MTFDDKLRMYARLLVERGMNVQSGQYVHVACEPYAEDLAVLIAEYAYERGASYVNVIYNDPRIARAQLTKAPEESRFFFPEHERLSLETVVERRGCVISLRTDPQPGLFDDIPELAAQYLGARQQAVLKRFHDDGVNKGLVQWCVACPPSPKSASIIYPHLHPEAALNVYWDAVFRMTFADQVDCLERWEKIDRKLHERHERLTDLEIRHVHFTGPGTDLTVGLSTIAQWLGGSTKTAYGISFMPNLPTFEVFTTPDWRCTHGTVRVTRPINVSGTMVKGLQLTFRDGKIVEVSAEENQALYEQYIGQDEGATRLGELALVGLDSPVLQESPNLRQILYTENAACHIATGNAYSQCIKGGWDMKPEILAGFGVNRSKTHLDTMISDKQVDVTALTYNGDEVPLLRQGRWVGTFA